MFPSVGKLLHLYACTTVPLAAISGTTSGPTSVHM